MTERNWGLTRPNKDAPARRTPLSPWQRLAAGAAWRLSRGRRAPYGLGEPEMLDFFKQAGAWMAQRRMRATLALGGSCALVLQSHIRARASDIDMVVCDASLPDSQIVTTNDAILIDETLSLAESVPTREWIDAAYSWFILKRPERLTRLVPYGDFLNKKGHGVTVRLVNLNNLWEGKRERLAKVQGCASFIPTDKGDFYGLSRLLGFDCANAFGKPENAEELEALAAQGPKCVVHRACKIG